MTDPTTWPVLDASLELLRTAADGVSDDQHDNPTPCSKWNVTQVVQHAALDQLIWASGIAGTPGPDGDAFAPTGHLDGTVDELLAPALRTAAATWATVAPDATAVTTPLPQGPMTADTAVAACALDAAVHGWDIAMATGQPSPLTPNLAAQLLPAAQAIVEPLRQYGAYAAALPDEPEDGAAHTLLRYLGRNPNWTP